MRARACLIVVLMLVCVVVRLSVAPSLVAAVDSQWQPCNAGLAITTVNCIAISPTIPSTLYAGTGGAGVFRSGDLGTSWTLATSGLSDLGGHDIRSVAVSPSAPHTVYYATASGVFRSDDDGLTWLCVSAGLDTASIDCMAVDPLNPAILLVGTYWNGVFCSKDSGASWGPSSWLGGYSIHCLAIDPETPSTIYAGTAGGVYKSADGGVTWAASGLADVFNVTCLAIDPATHMTVYAGTNHSGLFRSDSGGANWKLVSDGLTSLNVTAVVTDSVVSSTLYVGTNGGGVFRSSNRGASWDEMSNGLVEGWNSGKIVRCMAIDSRSSMPLYAGTQGGLFRWDSRSVALATAVEPSGAGMISRTPDQLTYAVGSSVSLHAMPAPGYVFAGWSGDLSGRTNPATVTMSDNKTVTATFATQAKRTVRLTIGSRVMYVDGSPVLLEAPPVILNARTLLPIRAVVEAVGGTIVWEASTRKVTIVRGTKTLRLWIDRNMAELNGQSVNIDTDVRVVPIIMNGRTLLPLRFVAEALGLDVRWDAETKTITIVYEL
jgi:uncharacterized repeat protein (TIGR02543 family)